MLVELPEKLEAAIKIRANAEGVSPAGYVCDVVERSLAPTSQSQPLSVPFKTGRGSLAKYGPAPSSEEIEANRADIFHNFGEEI